MDDSHTTLYKKKRRKENVWCDQNSILFLWHNGDSGYQSFEGDVGVEKLTESTMLHCITKIYLYFLYGWIGVILDE